jgi:thioredoxin-related protein
VGGYPKQKKSPSVIRKHFRCQRSCLLFANIALTHKKNVKKLLFLLLSVSLTACQGNTEKKGESKVEPNEPNDLPLIKLTVEGSSPVLARTLKGKVILIFFQPDCDHCQREAKQISENLGKFDTYKIYFTSTAPLDVMDKFATDYNLSNQDNIYFAQTSLDEILRSVGPISAPSMFIYEDQKLVKHLDGETPIEEILKHL